MHPPVLTTDRLILRQLNEKDASDMYAYASDPDVTRYLLWEPHESITWTREYLRFLQGEYAAGRFFDWAIVLKDEKGREEEMIGTVGFASFDFAANSAEIGYVVNPSYKNCGYTTEAVARVLRFAFQELELNRVQARYIRGNDASRRVMQKCGLREEGLLRGSILLRGEYVDVGLCAILAGEWYRNG